MIKVLIVDDSRTAQEFLTHVFSSDPAIQVVGVASNGIEALAAVRAKHPDIITMDIFMPLMGGYEATRAIMESAPTPIVVVSANATATDTASTFRALEDGALAVVLRPPGFGHPGHAAGVRVLLQTVKMMSEIKVVRRRASHQADVSLPGPVQVAARQIQLVAIGASTGGPPVLQKILSILPPNLAAAVFIVQHISPGFTHGFVDWLGSASGFPAHIAEDGQQPLPGHAYVAPDGFHLGVSSGLRILLSGHAPENGLRPSVAYLFRTAAQVLGPRAVGVLLTGMGADGAVELKEMKDRGALTIVQDKASSIIFGMPGEAVKLGAAMHILPPEAIAAMLADVIRKATGEQE